MMTRKTSSSCAVCETSNLASICTLCQLQVIKTSSTIEQISMECEFKKHVQSSAASFPYATDSSDIGKNENLIEGWDLVEHPTFPPPPSQTEDVEHWTRAVFIDATKK
ncbi:unnamed protein product [Camellia sinensis]